jgi:hypothetical protein
MSKYLKRDYTEEELIEIATKRIKVKRDLYSHLASYVFVNLFLVVISIFDQDFHFKDGNIPWVLWVIAGWGLGVAFHIHSTITDLKYKYNASALNDELHKIHGGKE